MTEETTGVPKGIHARMARAAQMVGYGVAKDGKNASQGYDFTSAANVRRVIGPALGAMGISVGSRIEILTDDRRPVGRNEWNYVMCKAVLTFSDGSGETVVAEGIGAGTDGMDKAPMKAQTAAEKYAYMSAFTIAMGEDPEADCAQPSSYQGSYRHDDRGQGGRDERVQEDQYHARGQAQRQGPPQPSSQLSPQDLLDLLDVDGIGEWTMHVNACRSFFALNETDKVVVWKALAAAAQAVDMSREALQRRMREAAA